MIRLCLMACGTPGPRRSVPPRTPPPVRSPRGAPMPHPPQPPPTLPEPWLDALVDLLLGIPPSDPLRRDLRAAGLLSDTDRPTPEGQAAIRATCLRRHQHAQALPFGGVDVTAGPHAGSAGYYDDDESLDLPPDLEQLQGWDPHNLAVVYLFAEGDFLANAPVLVPHHHLKASVHMDLERWVQANPVRAAALGIPSLSGIEEHVSREQIQGMMERVDTLLGEVLGDVPERDDEDDDDLPF